MNKLLLNICLMFLIFTKAKAQIIAGDSMSANVTYTNIPDIHISGISNGNYLDLDNDGTDDVEFWSTFLHSGGTTWGYEYIRSVRNTVELIEHTNYIDSIQNNTIIDRYNKWGGDTSFYLQNWGYYIPSGSYFYGSFYGNNKYIGFRIINTNDTSYGWILVNGSPGSITIKSYAINKSTTGIQQVTDSNAQVTVYPNPASNRVLVAIAGNRVIIEIKLMDVMGKEILNTKEKEIDISSLSEGFYFVQIKTNEGILTKKVVVQR